MDTATLTQQPARAIFKPHAHLLFHQPGSDARAIDKQISFQPLFGIRLHGGDVAIVGHFHVDHIGQNMFDAARRGMVTQIVSKFLGIHVIGVG